MTTKTTNGHTLQALALAVAVECGVPVLLWGAPGVGKTRTIEALARRMGLRCETVIAAIREPSDFAGLPVPDGTLKIGDQTVRATDLAPPAWAVRLAAEGRGVLFLDEISTAPPAVQAALLRVVLERAVGDLRLPDGVRIVAAANPTDTTTGVWELSAALANRFVHLSWEADHDHWRFGMSAGWPEPPVVRVDAGAVERAVQAARIEVTGFIGARRELLHKQPDEQNAGRGWPSPRSWDMAARLLGYAEAARLEDGGTLPASVAEVLLAGAVGEAAAIEFLAWRRTLDLPDVETLLADPMRFNPPANDDQLYVLLMSIADAVRANMTPARWKAAWKLLERVVKIRKGDLALLAGRALKAAGKAANTGFKPPNDFLDAVHDAGLVNRHETILTEIGGGRTLQ